MKISLRRASFLLAVFGLVSFGGTVYAQMPEFPQFPDLSQKIDKVLQKDIDIKSKFDQWKKFGIDFKSHVSVCDDTTGDTAHCDARVVADDKGKPAAATAPAGYSPSQIRKAYNLSGTASSGHPIIAIVDAYDDPYIASDLAKYSSQFGLPQLPTCSGTIKNSSVACFKKINQNGGSSVPFSNAGWALEISLDVETAHAICQNCSILLVEANSASFTNLMTAVDQAVAQGAKVISNSYGANEFNGETVYDSHFNRPGIVITASAGDSGYGVEYPAASRYVTAVGGTSLFLNSDNSYNSEAVWSGTGSGCSAYEAKQNWQTDPSCTKRMVSDVSADADPNTGIAVYDSMRYYGQSGWWQVGGTSLAAPIIASVYALSGNIPANTQENSLPYLNNPSANLNDVIVGTNGSCGGTYFCTGIAGFDGPTGLGTPKGTLAF